MAVVRDYSKRESRHFRPWTRKDDKILASVYPIHGAAKAAAALRRTVWACQARAHAIGVCVVITNSFVKRNHWTTREIAEECGCRIERVSVWASKNPKRVVKYPVNGGTWVVPNGAAREFIAEMKQEVADRERTKKWWSVKETAAYLGCSQNVVRFAMSGGRSSLRQVALTEWEWLRVTSPRGTRVYMVNPTTVRVEHKYIVKGSQK